ncbi:MAG: hypothetical protein KIT11_01955 [Fimbriimonadaceae bacterium]|nr:hypothetical protein [Fimbriimonadaceae bacterium]QYK54865.1 MAG: hypothetical protein KF733_07580 [Fimbriimonadaceae bacterium]
MRSLFALTLAALALGVHAQDTHQIIVKPKEGSSRFTSVNAEIEIMGMEIKIETEAESTITKVNPDGTFVEITKVTKAVQKMNDQQSTQDAGGERSTTRDKRGRVLERKGEETDENSARMSAAIDFVAPAQAVAVGETWELEEPANEATKAPKTKQKGTLKGIEEMDGKKVYVIEFENTLLEEPTMGGKGTIWLEVETGELVKLDAVLVNATIQGMQAEGHIVIKSRARS